MSNYDFLIKHHNPNPIFDPNEDVTNFFLCFDDNFALAAGTTITSVKLHCQQRRVFYLFTLDLSETNIQKIRHLEDELTEIQLYCLDRQAIHQHFSIPYKLIPTCLRLFVLDLLPQHVAKIFYLDSDVLCVQDINTFYQKDLKNNILLAQQDAQITRQDRTYLNIDLTCYFNAGILLINCKNWHDANCTQKALDLIQSGTIFTMWDQDILNLICYGRTQLAYSGLQHFVMPIQSSLDDSPPYHTLFLHYTAHKKPWFQCYLTQTFKDYLKKSPWANTPLALIPYPKRKKTYKDGFKSCLANLRKGKLLLSIEYLMISIRYFFIYHWLKFKK